MLQCSHSFHLFIWVCGFFPQRYKYSLRKDGLQIPEKLSNRTLPISFGKNIATADEEVLTCMMNRCFELFHEDVDEDAAAAADQKDGE